MDKPAIFIKKLCKSFGNFKAVEALDFEILPNECFGILGPNGAGKTTTMKIMTGKAVADPDPETVMHIFGFSPAKQALEIKALSGIVPQQDNLDLELNVADNLWVYAQFYGMQRGEAKQRIASLLAFMELSEKAGSKVRELSGGMQRRLSIARALLNEPKLLILDEPTTGLDPQVRHLIWNKLRELKEQGVTILLTTHYMEEAYQICDRLMIMDKGRKILMGNPRELLRQHLEHYVMEVFRVCSGNEQCSLYLKEKGIRYEFFNDILFAYSNDPMQLKSFGERLHPEDYSIRTSNLEDLFLKVTGRSLNALQ